MSTLSDKIITDFFSFINRVKIYTASILNKLSPLLQAIVSRIKNYSISKQNQLILNKRYIELAKYVHKMNLNSDKTDFSHDEEFNRLTKDISIMESYIDEIEKK